MKFIKTKPIKTEGNILKIAADFETVVVNGRHYVFAAGYKRISCELDDTTHIIYAYSVNIIVHGIERESARVIHEFIDQLIDIQNSSAYEKIYVYFHNFDGFDSMFLIEWIGNNLPNRYESVSFLDKNNKLYQLSLNKTLCFLDSMNIANSSLDSLAWDLLGENKLYIDHSTTMGSVEACIINKEEIKAYLTKDVDLLAGIIEAIDTTFKSMDLFITKNITASSLAYQLYLQKYYPKYYQQSWLIEKPTRIKYDYIEKAYFGGLVMVNKPITKNAKCYDVNSMYPSVMLNNDMPLGEGVWYYKKTWAWVKKTNMLGFVDCIVNVKKPGLPFRKSIGSGLTTPTGEFRGIYTTEELKFHETRGATIVWVFSALLYPKRGIIFREFVENLHSLRSKAKKENNNAMNLCIKLLMNGAYGKFGTRNEFSLKKYIKNLTDEKINNYETLFNRTVQVNKDTGLLYVHYNREELEDSLYKLRKANTELGNDEKTIKEILSGTAGLFSNVSKGVQIAAFTTSYARISLLNGIDEAVKYNTSVGNRNCEVVYTDTDSIILNAELPDYLLDKNELGKYKEEVDISEAIFLGPKTYMLKIRGEKCTLNATCKGCKRVMKGIPRQYVKEHTTCKTYEKLYKNVYSMEKDLTEPELFIYEKNFLRSLKKSEVQYIPDWKHSISLKTNKFKKIYKNGVWVSCEQPKTVYRYDTVLFI